MKIKAKSLALGFFRPNIENEIQQLWSLVNNQVLEGIYQKSRHVTVSISQSKHLASVTAEV